MGIKHGMSATRVYKIWEMMIQRCTNPNHSKYADYGGRGIRVCESWLSFVNFYADMGEPAQDHTLDRVDNNGGYSKENCRWATRVQQMRNKRPNPTAKVPGLAGVNWHKRGNKYQVHVTIEHRSVYLGLFDSFFDACCARKSAELLYYK